MEKPRVVPDTEKCAGQEAEAFESEEGEVFVDLIESLVIALIDKFTSKN